MSRVNIEDSFYRDYRFIKLVSLVGDFWKALGLVVGAWSLAQKHYLNIENNRMIPADEWVESPFEPLIECGLAIQKNEGVYLKGSSKQFAWLLQKQEAGRLGGRPPNQIKRQMAKAGESGRLTEESGLNPPTPTPTPTPTQKEINTRPLQDSAGVLEKVPEEQLVAMWNELRGRAAGIRKLNDRRRKALRRAWKDEPNIESWKTAILFIAASDFHQGLVKKWKASFDYLCEVGKINQLLELSDSAKSSGLKTVRMGE